MADDDTPNADQDDLDAMAPAHAGDLRAAADRLLRRERPSHTLSPTALVNEAYLRLAKQRQRSWSSGEGFLAAAVSMMKRVLSNHARDRHALKRGGRRERVSLESASIAAESGGAADIVRSSLERLRAQDARAADIALARLYRGLSNEVIAEAFDTSVRTVEREWALARAWLRAEIADGEDS